MDEHLSPVMCTSHHVLFACEGKHILYICNHTQTLVFLYASPNSINHHNSFISIFSQSTNINFRTTATGCVNDEFSNDINLSHFLKLRIRQLVIRSMWFKCRFCNLVCSTNNNTDNIRCSFALLPKLPLSFFTSKNCRRLAG